MHLTSLKRALHQQPGFLLEIIVIASFFGYTLAEHTSTCTQENSRQPENSTHAGEINEDGERREELSARCLFLFWEAGV